MAELTRQTVFADLVGEKGALLELLSKLIQTSFHLLVQQFHSSDVRFHAFRLHVPLPTLRYVSQHL